MDGETWTAILPLPEARQLARITLYDTAGYPLPGVIGHDGTGRITLDGDALMSLAIMHGSPGFELLWDGELPVLLVGADRYVLKQEPAARLTGTELSG